MAFLVAARAVAPDAARHDRLASGPGCWPRAERVVNERAGHYVLKVVSSNPLAEKGPATCTGSAYDRVDYHGVFWFPVAPSELWAAIERFDLFTSWWSWLRDFRADRAGLVDGNTLHGTVIPPVPYRLRLDVRLRQCERPRRVEAVVDGDLSGRAVLRLEDAADGTRATVDWSLRMRSAPLRLAARVAHPLMRWGHDRVVDMAVAGFRQRALPATAARSGRRDLPA